MEYFYTALFDCFHICFLSFSLPFSLIRLVFVYFWLGYLRSCVDELFVNICVARAAPLGVCTGGWGRPETVVGRVSLRFERVNVNGNVNPLQLWQFRQSPRARTPVPVPLSRSVLVRPALPWKSN